MNSQFETAKDIGLKPSDVVRRWMLEIKLSTDREKDWVKRSEQIIDKYKAKDAKKASFNILWANTETLKSALFVKAPKPDVRRRYRDDDPLGKAVSDVLTRSLDFSVDAYNFKTTIDMDVYDFLLTGRGVSRVRYIPSLTQVGQTEESHVEETETHEAGGEALEGGQEEISWEQVTCDHVQYDNLRIGPGKVWEHVNWVAFKHQFTRDDCIEKFGEEIGNKINLSDADVDGVREMEKTDPIKGLFAFAEVWEVWDKESKTVLFVSNGYQAGPCLEIEDPLGLEGFFPIPRPLYFIEDATTTVPTVPYDLYKEQADELDKISARIIKLTEACKVRGVYDSTFGNELSEVMRGQDNDLIPAQDVTKWLERGGIEKAIWFLPVEQIAKVLQILMEQRKACLAAIYELTGMSDLIRGQSEATETATAQQLKANYGGQRLRKLQYEVQRYVRDIIKMMGELIAEKFQPQTLAQMTLLKFPTMAEIQPQMIQAQQAGQQIEPPITWEQIIEVLRDNAQRTYRVDIETDSMLEADQQAEIQGLVEVVGGITQFIQGVGPAVQMQAIPIEAAKEIIMAFVRRAKMGPAIEDALEKVKQPSQAQDNSAQLQQMQQEHEAKLEQQRMQAEAQAEQTRMQHETQLEQMKAQVDIAVEKQKAQIDLQKSQMEMMMEAQLEKWKAMLDAHTKVAVAEIGAQATMSAAQESAAEKID